MRASLDTNVIIHLYQANKQHVLFDIFGDGVFIYEQIRYIELEHHGKAVLEAVDAINAASDLKWSFRSQLAKFIKRLITDPYKIEEKEWFEQWKEENHINVLAKFKALRSVLE